MKAQAFYGCPTKEISGRARDFTQVGGVGMIFVSPLTNSNYIEIVQIDRNLLAFDPRLRPAGLKMRYTKVSKNVRFLIKCPIWLPGWETLT